VNNFRGVIFGWNGFRVAVNNRVIKGTGLQETIIMMSLAQGESGGASKVAKFTPRASEALIDIGGATNVWRI
jgi:hypothetical protein